MRAFLADLRAVLPACAVWWLCLFGSAGFVFGSAYLTDLRQLRQENEHLRHELRRRGDVRPEDKIPATMLPVAPKE